MTKIAKKAATRKTARKKAPATTATPTPKPKRDHKAEAAKALANRVERIAVLREYRDSGALGEEIMQVAQSLILCGLPYKPTKERQIVRRARLADGSTVSVTFTAGLDDAEMPYGADRSLLHYLLDRAVKSGSRYISWSTAAKFLEHMGITLGGKNYADLRMRFERIRGLTIGVVRSKDGASSSQLMPFIRRSALPSSMEIRQEQDGLQSLPLSDTDPFGVEIDELFFNDLMAWHVPVPTQLIVQTRKNPQLQDMCVWLHWRCFAAQNESVIPWEYLAEQIWQADTKVRRIRERFNEAIQFARGMWPELRAEVRKDGLWVAPPRNGKHLLTQGEEVRRLR
jgi:hypothetical protein